MPRIRTFDWRSGPRWRTLDPSLLAPLSFPPSPPPGILQIERVPALIDAPRVALHHGVPGNSGWQVYQLGKAVEHRAPVAFGNARQQMPQGQSVARTSGGQQSAERPSVAAFEALHAATQPIGCVLEIRNPRTASPPCHASSARRDEGFAIAHLEGYPSHLHAQNTVARSEERRVGKEG